MKDDRAYKDSYLERLKTDRSAYENDPLKSALENNKNDLVSEQGDSGIKNIQMGRKMSKIEKEYLIRSQRFDRDEENPMYDDAHSTWGEPDHF
ncbi:hypothetical protein EDC19_1856 [Natranaerovirga hydrolytica]|uniref:Uncharacterized protein n=1 Tax=Natranaerovirga hydrolytica TaxID=680378 RepID=A0A4V2Q077_9FIRM|nr:hypothetical protein [Natranaerovirga hydrolytica]TCK92701.1 hypothetical protein EDC19_1856 [Natranaerovirga hydrolytica]